MGFFTYKNDDDEWITKKIIKHALVGVLALTTLWNSFTTLKQTERGIKYRFGKMITKNQNDLMRPGLNFHWPWITVKKARVDLQHMDINGMTTNTKDNQVIKVDNTIFYKTPEADLVAIYTNNPDWEEKLEKAATSAVKSALGQTEAQNVAYNRDSIMRNVTKETHNDVMKKLTIDVSDVLMPNYDFDEAYQKSVSAASNEKAILTGKQTKLLQDSIDKQRTIIRASAAADSIKKMADADAYTITTKKDAEAKGYKEVQEVIGFQNMGMYLYTSKWNGVKSLYETGAGGSSIFQIPQPK